MASYLTSLETQATAGILQFQAAANATIQTITSEVQVALNSSQQYVSALNISYQQAEACLIQKVTGLAAIANTSRK